MGDFNINFLNAEASCYAQDFLLSLQSFSFIPPNDPLEISNIFNNYFFSFGKNQASRVPRSSRYFTEYLSPNYNPSSFFFDPVTPEEIEREILLIPKNKTYGLYSCPIRILTDARCVISGPLSIIIKEYYARGHLPIQTEKKRTLFLCTKMTIRLSLVIIVRYRYCPFSIRYFNNIFYNRYYS